MQVDVGREVGGKSEEAGFNTFGKAFGRSSYFQRDFPRLK